MMNLDLEKIKEKSIRILKENGVKRASIFGSFARGEEKEGSDIDFLIEFEDDEKSLIDLIKLKEELEDELGMEVDILTYMSIHPLLKSRILKEQRVIL